MRIRKSGILLHVSSLPGKEGIGTFGENAFRFVDFLKETGQGLWQMLPLGETGYGNSPYLGTSAFAGNPLFIDTFFLKDEGLLTENEIKRTPKFNIRYVFYDKIKKWKLPLLANAYDNFQSNGTSEIQKQFKNFIKEQNWWLEDYALFKAYQEHSGIYNWTEWEDEVKFRDKNALNTLKKRLNEKINFYKFIQFLFFKQWNRLKDYANKNGVEILGDLPLYVDGNSVDVWANPDIFDLDEHLKPVKVGGVPPDYFSESGQLWGNPVYNWQNIKKRDFDWWIARLHFNIKLYDYVRIDHFRGLESYWSVNADEKNAINGEWVPAMGYELLKKFSGQVKNMPLIAEDLGIITPEVEELKNKFNLPGNKVLQFAFSSDERNQYLPHNLPNNCVVYTGTHDNDTTWAWYKATGKKERNIIKKYYPLSQKKIIKELIESAWSSAADIAVFPLQDLFELGSEARMNIPGFNLGNWGWRFRWDQIKKDHIKFLNRITVKYNRNSTKN